jgi:glucose/arabinose dehydrogenase
MAACCAVLACAAALLGALLAAPAGATTLAPGFQESIQPWTDLDTPIGIEFAPNGRVFVAEKSGIIKTYQNAADTTPTQVADLRTQVHNYWDRGLMSVAVDPAFPTRPNIYVIYL